MSGSERENSAEQRLRKDEQSPGNIVVPHLSPAGSAKSTVPSLSTDSGVPGPAHREPARAITSVTGMERLPKDTGLQTVTGERREAPPQECINGISFTSRQDRHHVDFAVHVTKLGNVFVLAASVPDISPFAQKDDPLDRLIRTEARRDPKEEGFIQEASFTKGQNKPAITFGFILVPNDDGTLQIIEPKIKRTQLNLRVMVPVDNSLGVEIVSHPKSRLLADALALAPFLTERYDDVDEDALFSASTLLYGLRKNMVKITEEALMQYCLDNDLPVIFREFNTKTFKSNYTLSPDEDAIASVPFAYSQTQHVAMVNQRVLLASLPDQASGQPNEFPYTDDELDEITGELNQLSRISTGHQIARQVQTGITDMPQDQFRQMVTNVFVKNLVRDPAVRELVEDELSNRMLDGTAHTSDVYDVLFNFSYEDDSFATLREEAIIALYTTPAYANKIFKIIVGKNSLKVKTLQTPYTDGDREQYDTIVVVESEKQVISEAFRTEDKKRGISVGNASIIAKLIGITPALEQELFEDAGIDATAILLDTRTKEKLLAKHAEKTKSDQDKLREFSQTYGFELLPPENSFYPDRIRLPHHSLVSIRIGDSIISRDTFAESTLLAECKAANKLLRLLTFSVNPEKIPDDYETQIPQLARELDLEDIHYVIQTTTNAHGDIVTHCITKIGDTYRYTFMGSGGDENTARKIAKQKLYFALQQDKARREE